MPISCQALTIVVFLLVREGVETIEKFYDLVEQGGEATSRSATHPTPLICGRVKKQSGSPIGELMMNVSRRAANGTVDPKDRMNKSQIYITSAG